MIRDLADSTVASVIQRHEDYWYNREVDVDDTSAIRPLFQFRPAQPLADTPHPHPLTPPAPLDPLSFRDHIEERYDDGGLLSDDLFNMISTGIPSEVLVGCPMVVRAPAHMPIYCPCIGEGNSIPTAFGHPAVL